MTQAAIVHAPMNLRAIADMWPLLVAERIPGTPRPWLQTRLRRGGHHGDPDDSGSFVIHGVTAPIRLDVLDAMQDCLRWSETTHAKAALLLGEPHRPGHIHDPIRHLADLAAWWERIEVADPALAERIAAGLEHHHDAIGRTLGLALDGKVLPFPCPFCLTTAALVIRRYDDLGVVIVCTSGACTPPPRASTHLWHEGLPAWRFAQWATLAAACNRGGS